MINEANKKLDRSIRQSREGRDEEATFTPDPDFQRQIDRDVMEGIVGVCHTPGPWRPTDLLDAVEAERHGKWEIIAAPFALSTPEGQNPSQRAAEYKEATANCRLIAAAPGLLGALRRALEALQDGDEYQGEILEVIAEAKEAISKVVGQ